MKDTANNLALGLGVAVLGFALYRYFQGQGATNAAAPSSSTPSTVSILDYREAERSDAESKRHIVDRVFHASVPPAA